MCRDEQWRNNESEEGVHGKVRELRVNVYSTVWGAIKEQKNGEKFWEITKILKNSARRVALPLWSAPSWRGELMRGEPIGSPLMI